MEQQKAISVMEAAAIQTLGNGYVFHFTKARNAARIGDTVTPPYGRNITGGNPSYDNSRMGDTVTPPYGRGIGRDNSAERRNFGLDRPPPNYATANDAEKLPRSHISTPSVIMIEMMAEAMSANKELVMTFHGRILDQLGSQTYQSPVASIAELVSNAWDADAETVNVWLPDGVGEGVEVVIKDDGSGLTYKECQSRYLNIGYCRRGKKPVARTEEKKRVVLGRKGIGKFAGFGIARIIRVDTISKSTGGGKNILRDELGRAGNR